MKFNSVDDSLLTFQACPANSSQAKQISDALPTVMSGKEFYLS